MCVFLLFFVFVAVWEKNKQEKLLACPCQKFNQGCLLFFGRKRKTIFLNLSWIHKSLLRAYYKHRERERERERET